jgi:MoxR-like ATPase
MSQSERITTFDQPHKLVENIIDNVEKVIVGKRKVIEKAMVALLCGGHVLLEDVPGVGKTTLIRTIAKSVGCSFKRIQFTPDLLPSDVTGVSIYNQKTIEFEFRPGPIMGNIVLADEINRTSPKTQAALLEAMEEGNITVDGESYPLPQPFFIMATQNPIEYEGTFPLPEAQLDRFLIKIHLGYPDVKEEVDLLGRIQESHPIDTLQEVISRDQLLDLQRETRRVHVEESLREYIVKLTTSSRTHQDVYLGASPRASIALFRTAQAYAFLQGRSYVIPDDIKEMVVPTLGHRLLLKSESRLSGRTVEYVINQIVSGLPVPITRQGSWK